MMSEEILTQKIATIEELLKKNSDLSDSELQNIRAEQSPHPAETVVKVVEGLRVEGRRLNVGVIGRVKAGKSSLINALLFQGKTILPKSATPMTAALTTIEEGESVSASVEFFFETDISKLKEKSLEHKELLEAEVSKRVAEISERLARSKKSNPQQPDRGKIEAQVLREIEHNNRTLSSASDLYSKIAASGIDVGTLGDTRHLEARNIEELNSELNRYVGAGGDYMPFTKTLSISLPDEGLKGLKVIDTPGLNDAVASREQRTYEMLNQCDVVFIVSPAGQFLNSQDLELAGRLTKREGVREIYVVASQIDTQLHGDEFRKAGGNLPEVIAAVRTVLARQADSVLRSQRNEVLQGVAGQQDKKLILTSGICQTLLAQPKDEWDENAHHVNQHLREDYSSYFASDDDAHVYLEELSGRSRLLHELNMVREQKDRIQATRLDDYLSDQSASLDNYINVLTAYFKKLKNHITTIDKKQIESRIRELGRMRNAGEAAAREVFHDKVEELGFNLSDHLQQFVDEIFTHNREDMKASEGIKTESYKAEKDGVGSWLARKIWGGGYETRTRELTIVDTAEVRDAIENLLGFVEDGISEVARRNLVKWRTSLQSELSRSVRESMGDDEYIESDKLSSACRRVIADLGELPEAMLPKRPDELSASEKKEGREAEEYMAVAKDFYSSLRKAARDHVKILRAHVATMADADLENQLFVALKRDMEKQQELVANKELTLEKLGRVIEQLEGVANA